MGGTSRGLGYPGLILSLFATAIMLPSHLLVRDLPGPGSRCEFPITFRALASVSSESSIATGAGLAGAGRDGGARDRDEASPRPSGFRDSWPAWPGPVCVPGVVGQALPVVRDDHGVFLGGSRSNDRGVASEPRGCGDRFDLHGHGPLDVVRLNLGADLALPIGGGAAGKRGACRRGFGPDLLGLPASPVLSLNFWEGYG